MRAETGPNVVFQLRGTPGHIHFRGLQSDVSLEALLGVLREQLGWGEGRQYFAMGDVILDIYCELPVKCTVVRGDKASPIHAARAVLSSDGSFREIEVPWNIPIEESINRLIMNEITSNTLSKDRQEEAKKTTQSRLSVKAVPLGVVKHSNTSRPFLFRTSEDTSTTMGLEIGFKQSYCPAHKTYPGVPGLSVSSTLKSSLAYVSIVPTNVRGATAQNFIFTDYFQSNLIQGLFDKDSNELIADQYVRLVKELWTERKLENTFGKKLNDSKSSSRTGSAFKRQIDNENINKDGNENGLGRNDKSEENKTPATDSDPEEMAYNDSSATVTYKNTKLNKTPKVISEASCENDALVDNDGISVKDDAFFKDIMAKLYTNKEQDKELKQILRVIHKASHISDKIDDKMDSNFINDNGVPVVSKPVLCSKSTIKPFNKKGLNKHIRPTTCYKYKILIWDRPTRVCASLTDCSFIQSKLSCENIHDNLCYSYKSYNSLNSTLSPKDLGLNQGDVFYVWYSTPIPSKLSNIIKITTVNDLVRLHREQGGKENDPIIIKQLDSDRNIINLRVFTRGTRMNIECPLLTPNLLNLMMFMNRVVGDHGLIPSAPNHWKFYDTETGKQLLKLPHSIPKNVTAIETSKVISSYETLPGPPLVPLLELSNSVYKAFPKCYPTEILSVRMHVKCTTRSKSVDYYINHRIKSRTSKESNVNFVRDALGIRDMLPNEVAKCLENNFIVSKNRVSFNPKPYIDEGLAYNTRKAVNAYLNQLNSNYKENYNLDSSDEIMPYKDMKELFLYNLSDRNSTTMDKIVVNELSEGRIPLLTSHAINERAKYKNINNRGDSVSRVINNDVIKLMTDDIYDSIKNSEYNNETGEEINDHDFIAHDNMRIQNNYTKTILNYINETGSDNKNKNNNNNRCMRELNESYPYWDGQKIFEFEKELMRINREGNWDKFRQAEALLAKKHKEVKELSIRKKQISQSNPLASQNQSLALKSHVPMEFFSQLNSPASIQENNENPQQQQQIDKTYKDNIVYTNNLNKNKSAGDEVIEFSEKDSESNNLNDNTRDKNKENNNNNNNNNNNKNENESENENDENDEADVDVSSKEDDALDSDVEHTEGETKKIQRTRSESGRSTSRERKRRKSSSDRKERKKTAANKKNNIPETFTEEYYVSAIIGRKPIGNDKKTMRNLPKGYGRHSQYYPGKPLQMFYIVWQNYSDNEATWEPEWNIDTSFPYLDAFDRHFGGTDKDTVIGLSRMVGKTYYDEKRKLLETIREVELEGTRYDDVYKSSRPYTSQRK